MKYVNTYEDVMVTAQTLRLKLLRPNTILNRIRRVQCMVLGHSLALLDKIDTDICDRCDKTLCIGDNNA